MKRDKTGLATVLFIFGILLAGFANAASKLVNIKYNESQGAFTAAPFLSTLMFCLNLAIYIFLLVFWLHSVQRRLLPSRSRSYLIAAALSAIALLTLRSIKYRMIDLQAYEANRYLWYFYYVPMILLPTLFLMTCVNIERKNKPGRFDERLLLIPASILIILILTNDLHHLAFLPNGDLVLFSANGYYKNNILFYVYYAYYVVMIAAGLVLLIRANHRLHSFKKAVLPFLFLLIMLGLVIIDKSLNFLTLPSMFAAPEIVSFGMVGIFESCVRNRLIPYNENYAGFFASMRFPAVITQSDLTAAHRLASPFSAEASQLKASLEKPLYLDKDTKLTGKPVTAGFAFYTEDERELHRMNDKLIDANELIASENDLIEADNMLKMRQAQVDSRNMIYSEINERAFNNCPNLTSITVPRTVTYIGVKAFGYNNGEKIDGFTIYGYTGSKAQSYAKNNGFNFVEVGAYNGITGDCEWKFNPSTGTMTISGSGVMADYTYSNDTKTTDAPWWDYRDEITSVVFGNSVTAVDKNAFFKCVNLTSLSLENGVKTLGFNAFCYCDLTEVRIVNVETIGTNEYQYSVLDYVRNCLNSENVPYNTMTLISATYWYNQAANDYFGR